MGLESTDYVLTQAWVIENHGAPGTFGLMSRESGQSITVAVTFTPSASLSRPSGSESIELVHAGDTCSWDLADVDTISVIAGTALAPGSYPAHVLVNFTTLNIMLTAAPYLAGGPGTNVAPGSGAGGTPGPIPVVVVVGGDIVFSGAKAVSGPLTLTDPTSSADQALPLDIAGSLIFDTGPYANAAPVMISGLAFDAGTCWTAIRAGYYRIDIVGQMTIAASGTIVSNLAAAITWATTAGDSSALVNVSIGDLQTTQSELALNAGTSEIVYLNAGDSIGLLARGGGSDNAEVDVYGLLGIEYVGP